MNARISRRHLYFLQTGRRFWMVLAPRDWGLPDAFVPLNTCRWLLFDVHTCKNNSSDPKTGRNGWMPWVEQKTKTWSHWKPLETVGNYQLEWSNWEETTSTFRLGPTGLSAWHLHPERICRLDIGHLVTEIRDLPGPKFQTGNFDGAHNVTVYIYIIYCIHIIIYICIYTYIYIYMVIDLKVLVRSFNCESRACYVGNPRESFFSSSRK